VRLARTKNQAAPRADHAAPIRNENRAARYKHCILHSLIVCAAGCAEASAHDPSNPDGRGPSDPNAARSLDGGAGETPDGGAGPSPGDSPTLPATSNRSDVRPGERFVTSVVSFHPGPCAGFGASLLPGIVTGAPVGAGSRSGGLDVLSLGTGGEIVVAFEPFAIIDGPGPDFVVFENAFWVGGNSERPAADLGEVSVSDDGVTWRPFSCNTQASASYGTCAGWRPVFSAPTNAISPFNTEQAGGDAFDLADLGITRARFVKIRDLASVACPESAKGSFVTAGFDLDAIALVHAEKL